MGKAPDIGLKGAKRALSQKGHEGRLAFIAEGLPLILASGQGFWSAARALWPPGARADRFDVWSVEDMTHLAPARRDDPLKWEGYHSSGAKRSTTRQGILPPLLHRHKQ